MKLLTTEVKTAFEQEKNILLTKSIVNDVIFAEKPYEMGIIQILNR